MAGLPDGCYKALRARVQTAASGARPQQQRQAKQRQQGTALHGLLTQEQEKRLAMELDKGGTAEVRLRTLVLAVRIVSAAFETACVMRQGLPMTWDAAALLSS